MGTMGQSITLANSIIGVGILAMPFCFQQCGVLLATLILLFMGLVSRLCCYFLLKSALLARRRNFEFLAFHVFGSAGKFAVEVGIIGFLMGTCIAYFVVVGDLGPQIISKMFNINQSDMLRTSIMVIVSLVCVLPLGLLRNVDSLSNVSAATIGFYFCLAMKVIAEAATVLVGGSWQTRVEMWRPAGVLQCVPIFSMALFCQTQLFELFESLPSLSLEKMNLVTKNAINICTGVYFTLGLFGYIAFNTQEISGNILMSLSPTMANDVIKLGFVMSLAFSFPLIIFPCRASLYSLLYKKVHSSHHDHIINHSIPEGSFRRITVGIVAVTLGASLVLPNIELVLGLVGSTIGVLVCLVFPATCFLHLTFKDTNERLLAKGILILGLIIMVLGTYANLQAAENQVDKYDEKYITKERIDKIVEDFFQNQEKNNDVILKPEPNDKEITNKVNGDIIKESVVLPPNPVPPESQSNERNGAEVKGPPVIKEVLPNPVKDTLDKVSESHPKNLNKGNEVKIANEDKKDDLIREDKEIQNNNKNTKEELKPQANEEKINIIKQQKLIETIKQHGEEQKELIKEQKEILHEIYKTKQELEKNKNEAANEDAKKIAVESIKKIANLALQSLAGVTEKPGQVVEEKKADILEKLADEAVQEIAQKAVETIEAIKEIQEKPEQPIKLPNPPVFPSNIPVSNGNINNNVAGNNQNSNIPHPAPQVSVSNNNQNGYNNGNAQVIQNNINTNQQFNAQPVNQPQSIQSVAQPNNNQVVSNMGQSLSNIQRTVNAAQNNAQVVNNVQNIGQAVNNIAQPGHFGQAVNNVAQPGQNIGQAVNSIAQPGQNIGQSVNNIAQPGQNIGQAENNVGQPRPNIGLTGNNQAQPSQNSGQAESIVAQPVLNIGQAGNNIAQSAQNINQAGNIAAQPSQNFSQAENNVAQLASNIGQTGNNAAQLGQNIAQAAINVAQHQEQALPNFQAHLPQPVANIPEPLNIVKRALDSNLALPDNNVNNQQASRNAQNNVQTNQLVQNKVNRNQQIMQENIVKEHSHSPDEPQSYKQGEDSQKNNNIELKNNAIDQNIPLALAMNENSQLNQKNINNNGISKNIPNNVQNGDNIHDSVPLRRKREVVDCTEKSLLKTEDKEICKALIDAPSLQIVDNNLNDILPSKIDLNDVGLRNNLPMLSNDLHLSRSLKSIEDGEKVR